MVKENKHTHTKTHTNLSGEERLQWFWKYDRRKNRGIEDTLKEIDPSICTDTFYISIIQRQPALGLTRMVITRLQQNCDSTVTRMNRLSSHSNQNTCCQGNYIFTHSIYFFHLYPLQPLFNYLSSHKKGLCGLYATFPSICMSSLLSTDKLCNGPLCL